MLMSHAAKAAESFRKAKELNPKEGLYALGLASLLEQFADWNDEAKVADLPPSLAGNLRVSARAEYLLAWTLASPEDARVKNIPVGGLGDLVSYEAGRAFLRFAEAGNGGLPETEKAAMKRIKPAIEKLEKLPPGPITPLVLALTPHARLADLLAAWVRGSAGHGCGRKPGCSSGIRSISARSPRGGSSSATTPSKSFGATATRRWPRLTMMVTVNLPDSNCSD